MRASRSAMSCGCARAWPGARKTTGACAGLWRAGRTGSILDLLCTLPHAQPQGVVFSYSNGESCLLGALVAAATGPPLADYGAETIWGPAGMEANAY